MATTSPSLLTSDRVPIFASGAAAVRRTAAAGVAGWRRLTVKEQSQQQTEWCWDASSLSIHAYYDPDSTWTQCAFAGRKIGRSDCCTHPGSDVCNQPNYPDEALTLLGNFAGLAGALAMPAVKTEIDAGRPVSVRIGWSEGGGHNPVIVGYRSDSGGDWVAVADPWYGPSDVRLATFSTAYQGSGSWTDTYRTRSARLRVGTLKTSPKAAVTVASRDAHTLDVFAADSAGAVQTAGYVEGGRPSPWRPWSSLAHGLAAPGAAVAVVSRAPGTLDVFTVGTNGRVYTSGWWPGASTWRPWSRVGALTVPGSTPLHAISAVRSRWRSSSPTGRAWCRRRPGRATAAGNHGSLCTAVVPLQGRRSPASRAHPVSPTRSSSVPTTSSPPRPARAARTAGGPGPGSGASSCPRSPSARCEPHAGQHRRPRHRRGRRRPDGHLAGRSVAGVVGLVGRTREPCDSEGAGDRGRAGRRARPLRRLVRRVCGDVRWQPGSPGTWSGGSRSRRRRSVPGSRSRPFARTPTSLDVAFAASTARWTSPLGRWRRRTATGEVDPVLRSGAACPSPCPLRRLPRPRRRPAVAEPSWRLPAAPAPGWRPRPVGAGSRRGAPVYTAGSRTPERRRRARGGADGLALPRGGGRRDDRDGDATLDDRRSSPGGRARSAPPTARAVAVAEALPQLGSRTYELRTLRRARPEGHRRVAAPSTTATTTSTFPGSAGAGLTPFVAYDRSGSTRRSPRPCALQQPPPGAVELTGRTRSHRLVPLAEPSAS